MENLLKCLFFVLVFKHHVHTIKESLNNEIDGNIHIIFEPANEFETYRTYDQQCLR